MNKRLAKFAREDLKKNLSKCTEEENKVFQKMYGDPSESIQETISNMPDDKLSWAMTQVDNTLKNKNT